MNNDSKHISWREEDFKNWDKLVQQCETIKGLTKVEKAKAKDAFEFLKDELGEEFLEVAFTERHPIIFEIINLVALSRRRITDFAESLSYLKNAGNYVSLIRRIKDPRRFHEAVSVLEVAYKFFQVGYKITFDPEVASKQPDLSIIDITNNETSFIEVALQGESRNRREASNILRQIQKTILSINDILFCVKIHKIFADQHLREIIGKITQLSKRAKNLNKFQEFIIENTIELAIAPKNDVHIIKAWAAGRHLDVGSLSGPSYDSNEILRVKRKIEKEQQQLPAGYPNILVISNPMVFQYCPDIKKLLTELEEEVYRYPQVLAALICGGYIGYSKSTSIVHDQHLYIEKTRYGIMVEQYILLQNRFCNVGITPAIMPKIQTAFSRY